MGFLDRLFGTQNAGRQVPPVPQNPYGAAASGPPPAAPGYAQPPRAQTPLTPPPAYAPAAGHAPAQPSHDDDALAIERYRYLLRTAPPQTIEQVHAEAFSRLSPAQRQQVLAELKAGLPPYEQPRATDPQSLARAATRAEYRSPGFMERTFGASAGGRPGYTGSPLFGTMVGFVIGSALVSSIMYPAYGYDAGYQDGVTDAGAAGGDAGAGDAAAGADASGWGGDGAGWDGGADFGGGDFGGGDFGF